MISLKTKVFRAQMGIDDYCGVLPDGSDLIEGSVCFLSKETFMPVLQYRGQKKLRFRIRSTIVHRLTVF